MNKVFYNLQNKLAEVQNLPEFAMEAYKTDMLMWSWFLISSMTAAIHLNVQELRIQFFESLFNVTKMLIMDNTEVRNVKCLDCETPLWTRSTLLNDQAVQLARAKVYVYSDSVLCMGKVLNNKGKQLNNGKAKWQLFEWRTILSMSCWEWMENQLNSSGKIA